MPIQYHDLRYAEYLQPGPQRAQTLHLVHARGRAMQFEVPVGWLSLWVPLSGGLRVESSDIAWNLVPRDLLIWHEGGLRNCGRHPNWFLVLCGPIGAWRPYLPKLQDEPVASRMLFPSHDACPREVRRLLVRLARLARRTDICAAAIEQLTAACCSAIVENQRDLHAWLMRCRGRTASRRLQTLLRLLRVHHLIGSNPNTRFDLLHLGRVANYSSWHLVRAYRDVFGETPSEHATRIRLARAMEMVRGSSLTVGEITEALGFESQSTFCRSFKNAYGVTTTQARSLHRSPAMPMRRAG